MVWCGVVGVRRGEECEARALIYFSHLAVSADAAGGGQAHEVDGPSDHEVGEDLEAGEEAVTHPLVQHGVVADLLPVRADTVLLLGAGHVALAVDEVVRPPVVLGVAVLPGEVRDEKGLVEDVAHAVVEEAGGGEGVMSALVGEDPVAGQDGAHPERVQVPAHGPDNEVEGEQGGHGGGQVSVGKVGAGDGPGRVAEDKVEAVHGAALEALKFYKVLMIGNLRFG